MEQDLPTSWRWALAVIAASMFSNPACAAGPKVTVNIPAGGAGEALREFYLQSRVKTLFLTNTVKGVETPAVIGEFAAASDALDVMFEGTGLTYEFVDEFSVLIYPSQGTLAAPLVASTPAAPGEGPNVPVPATSEVEEVLVTGSLIHGVFDITSPLFRLRTEEIRRTPYATVQDAVQGLPLAATVTRSEVAGGLGNDNRGAGINLRGLGDSATLVLVNGRRQPPAGSRGDFVDVSNIPWSMVDRIEVLPDGGSALYGSDAVAGVVNILLREDLEGLETQLRYGTAPNGAAESLASQLVGHRWTGGRWLIGYQYYERTSLDAADRRFAANADKRPFGGRDLRSVSSSPGNILDPQTLLPMFALPEGQDGTSLTPGDLLPNAVNYSNHIADTQLLPNKRTHNLYFTASQELNERLELFAEGRYAQRDTQIRPWSSADGGAMLFVPATNAFFVDPFGNAPFVIVAYDMTKDLGPLTDRGRTRSYFGTVGLKAGATGSWQASLSASYGAEDLHWAGYGNFNPAALNAALADPNPATAFNPFGDGSHTNPATIKAIDMGVARDVWSEISSIQLTADGPLLDLPSGTAKLAIGGEYRGEKFRQDNIIDIYNQIPDRVQGDREIAALFAELSIPLLGDPADTLVPPRLELSLSGRYERYDDFGRTSNPKIGLRWTPLASTKLRASWGTSFRAPNLIDLDDSRNTALLVSLPDPRSSTGRSDILGLLGGNPDLKEERATTWTAGFDLAPQALPGFQLSLTAYSIDYEDQVVRPGPLNLFDFLLQESQWTPVVTRNPSQAQLNAICDSPHFVGDPALCRTAPTLIIDARQRNLAMTKVRGVDFKLTQSFVTDWGHLNVELNGARVFQFERALSKTATAVDVVDTVDNPLAFRVRGVVEWQQHGKNMPGFGATLTSNYAGGYEDTASPVRHRVGSWKTFDLQLSYRTGQRGDWTDSTELALNISNALNQDPPFVDREWGYDWFNALPTGRVISAYVSKHW